MEWECSYMRCHLTEPPKEEGNLQPWQVIFTLFSLCWCWPSSTLAMAHFCAAPFRRITGCLEAWWPDSRCIKENPILDKRVFLCPLSIVLQAHGTPLESFDWKLSSLNSKSKKIAGFLFFWQIFIYLSWIKVNKNFDVFLSPIWYFTTRNRSKKGSIFWPMCYCFALYWPMHLKSYIRETLNFSIRADRSKNTIFFLEHFEEKEEK